MFRAFTRSLISLAVLISFGLAAAVPLPEPAVAQSGADMEATITGPRHVRIGEYITYTITGTNIGDATAIGVQLAGWTPDWFGSGSVGCLSGTLDEYGRCAYPDLAPGDHVSMIITLLAVAGNKQERRMYELGWAYAANDINPDNNEARIDVNMIGPCRFCANK